MFVFKNWKLTNDYVFEESKRTLKKVYLRILHVSRRRTCRSRVCWHRAGSGCGCPARGRYTADWWPWTPHPTSQPTAPGYPECTLRSLCRWGKWSGYGGGHLVVLNHEYWYKKYNKYSYDINCMNFVVWQSKQIPHKKNTSWSINNLDFKTFSEK